MRPFAWLGIAVCLFGASARLMAQVDSGHSAGDGAPLSLDEARREALARDPVLVRLNAEMEAARQREQQSTALDAPMIEGQIWQWPINTFNPSNVDMYMLSVSQEFPGKGKRALRAAVVEADVSAILARIEGRSRELEAEVRAAYIEVATARRTGEIQRSTLPLLRQAVAVSQAHYESGTGSQTDVLAGAIAVSRVYGDLIELDESEQLATARLNTLMLREPGRPVGRLDDLSEAPLLLPVTELERIALEHHPDLAEGRAMGARATAMENEVRGDQKPDVRVSGGYMFRPRAGDAWLASVGITWPKAPWARGKADALVSEARAENDAVAATIAAATAAIKLSVREGYVKATAAQQRAALIRSTIVPQSEQAIATASLAYQAEQVDFQTVLAEQRMLLESRIAYSRAAADAAQAIAALERVVGSPVTMVGGPAK